MRAEKNSLASTYPALAVQAHGWDPSMIVGFENKKLEWICPKEHTFLATPAQRMRSGAVGACPVCIGRKILVGYNDLLTTDPQIAKQANGWDPRKVTRGSGQVLSWKCLREHVWSCKVQAMVNGVGCPYCAKTKPLSGFNDLSTTHPKIAAEADGWDPSVQLPGSHKRVSWKCVHGHKWFTTIRSRTSRNSGCPICINKILCKGFNDLATTHPELAAEADGWDPTNLISGANKKMNWKCKKGHKYNSLVSSRAQGIGCPVCAGKKVIPGVNDLATLNPKLAKEAFGWNPATFTVGSGKKVCWKCPKGHLYESSISARSSGRGCPVCRGFKIEIGDNDLATIHPKIASQAFGWDPKTVTAGSAKRLDWKCSFGHIWKTSVANRFQGGRENGSDCPVCAGDKVLKGFNDLATKFPTIALEADGWDPSNISSGTRKKVGWKCNLGHKYEMTVVLRTNQGSGCPYCSGNRVLIGFNDLLTINPELANQAVDVDPKTVTTGSKTKVKWKCEQGHIWVAAVQTRKVSGCPTCAESGFDPNSKGWLYFIRQNKLEMLQIGITNNPKTRMANHRTRGWEEIEIIGPMDGLTARRWEQAILKYIRVNGAAMGPTTDVKPFEGYTESWLEDSFKAESLKQLMDMVRKSEWE
jgi:Probable Zinc-ribbon domain